MGIIIKLNMHPDKRENLLDEISDIKTETIVKYYPLICGILDIIKENVIKDLNKDV